jgi:hypothetical protein
MNPITLFHLLVPAPTVSFFLPAPPPPPPPPPAPAAAVIALGLNPDTRESVERFGGDPDLLLVRCLLPPVSALLRGITLPWSAAGECGLALLAAYLLIFLDGEPLALAFAVAVALAEAIDERWGLWLLKSGLGVVGPLLGLEGLPVGVRFGLPATQASNWV